MLPVLVLGERKMPEQIENKMVVDWCWNEIEYGVPSSNRMKRERQAYEHAEREENYEQYII